MIATVTSFSSRRKLGALAVLCALTAASGCSSGGSPTSARRTTKAQPTTTSPTTAPASTATAAPNLTRPQHVFIVMLENEDAGNTFSAASPATYLTKNLVSQGAVLPQYYGIGHNSLDNYIAQVSGQAPNRSTQADCTTYTDFVATGPVGLYGQLPGHGCVYPSSVPTIAGQLQAKGLTWRAYEEDMGNTPPEPTTCAHPAIGSPDPTVKARRGDQYATRHDPFVYFHSIIDTADCTTGVVRLEQLPTDLASVATTPNLVYITPNLCHDGHDAPCVDGEPGGLVSANQFLETWVPRILASPAFVQDGMLIVTFDEAGTHDATACCDTPPSPNASKPGLTGPGGGRVGAVVVSPFVRPGTVTATPYNHYSLLCSLEENWGLDKLGFAGAPGLACFGADVYNAPRP
ncbi:MAG: phosphoesterase [Actinomycetia bacterium]|nr:phosphoesterase [Actinomycetes bacterium]